MTCDEALRQYWNSLDGDAVFDIYMLGEVRAVAVKGTNDDWAAYIGTGDNSRVAAHGAKLTEQQARTFFTQALMDCGHYRG
jgi:hypothetical protein